MIVKILFFVSVMLSGLFLAAPEVMGPIANFGGEAFSIGRLAGILAVVFEGRWLIRRLQNK